jgi:hypothetical protein
MLTQGFIVTLFFLLSGCAQMPPGETDSSVQKPSPDRPINTVIVNLESEKITLHFKHLDGHENHSLVLPAGLSKWTMRPGHWELSALEKRGRSYTANLSSKKFVLSVPKKNVSYAGSILMGCPKLETKDFSSLKRMGFFNRYSMRSEAHGICEFVVGNDFASVKNELGKSSETKTLKLIMGF